MTARMPSPLGYLLAACPILVGLAGCGAMDEHRERRIPQLGVVDPAQPRELDMVSLPPHVVEPPDELDISIRPMALDGAQTAATVQTDGNIDLGFLGDVYVAGLTLEEVEQKLTRRYRVVADAQGVREPVRVSVRLLNGRDSKRFYVLGTVTNPNSYPITGNETVLDAILLAGLRSNSLPDKAYLVRPHPIGGHDQIFRIDWCGITQRGDTLTNYQLLPGDRIYVPGGRPPSLLQSLTGG